MKTVDILRKAKEIYESGRYCGMCSCICEAIEACKDITEDEYKYITEDEYNNFIKNNIPLFSYDVAVQKFGATGHPDFYWWDKWDMDERIRYFDWLIERYSKKY